MPARQGLRHGAWSGSRRAERPPQSPAAGDDLGGHEHGDVSDRGQRQQQDGETRARKRQQTRGDREGQCRRTREQQRLPVPVHEPKEPETDARSVEPPRDEQGRLQHHEASLALPHQPSLARGDVQQHRQRAARTQQAGDPPAAAHRGRCPPPVFRRPYRSRRAAALCEGNRGGCAVGHGLSPGLEPRLPLILHCSSGVSRNARVGACDGGWSAARSVQPRRFQDLGRAFSSGWRTRRQDVTLCDSRSSDCSDQVRGSPRDSLPCMELTQAPQPVPSCPPSHRLHPGDRAGCASPEPFERLGRRWVRQRCTRSGVAGGTRTASGWAATVRRAVAPPTASRRGQEGRDREPDRAPTARSDLRRARHSTALDPRRQGRGAGHGDGHGPTALAGAGHRPRCAVVPAGRLGVRVPAGRATCGSPGRASAGPGAGRVRRGPGRCTSPGSARLFSQARSSLLLAWDLYDRRGRVWLSDAEPPSGPVRQARERVVVERSASDRLGLARFYRSRSCDESSGTTRHTPTRTFDTDLRCGARVGFGRIGRCGVLGVLRENVGTARSPSWVTVRPQGQPRSASAPSLPPSTAPPGSTPTCRAARR